MIGEFKVWHKGENRPATSQEIDFLCSDGDLWIDGLSNSPDGNSWPALTDAIKPYFEIRKMDKE